MTTQAEPEQHAPQRPERHLTFFRPGQVMLLHDPIADDALKPDALRKAFEELDLKFIAAAQPITISRSQQARSVRTLYVGDSSPRELAITPRTAAEEGLISGGLSAVAGTVAALNSPRGKETLANHGFGNASASPNWLAMPFNSW